MIRIAGIAGVSEFKVKAELNKKITSKVAQSALKELFTDIVKSTPVDTGRLKGNWQIGAKFTQSENGIRDKSGQRAISNINTYLNGYKLGSPLSFYNNAPYSELIEKGRSQQAPSGMVAINVIRFNSILKKAISRHGDK